jgi:hypothetical protein
MGYAAVPSCLLMRGEALLRADPCVDALGSPGSGYFRGMQLVHAADSFPGFRTKAAAVSGKAHSACATTFHRVCLAPKDEAARVQACGEWREWLAWQRARGIDPERSLGCAPCQ